MNERYIETSAWLRLPSRRRVATMLVSPQPSGSNPRRTRKQLRMLLTRHAHTHMCTPPVCAASYNPQRNRSLAIAEALAQYNAQLDFVYLDGRAPLARPLAQPLQAPFRPPLPRSSLRPLPASHSS